MAAATAAEKRANPPEQKLFLAEDGPRVRTILPFKILRIHVNIDDWHARNQPLPPNGDSFSDLLDYSNIGREICERTRS